LPHLGFGFWIIGLNEKIHRPVDRDGLMLVDRRRTEASAMAFVLARALESLSMFMGNRF
jgi:hypothetical protein